MDRPASIAPLKPERLRKRLSRVCAEVYPHIQPVRGKVLCASVLLVGGRLLSLVMPASFRYLIDGVLVGRNYRLLYWILFANLTATCLQGVAVFKVTKILGRIGEQYLASIRSRLQAHVLRLPVHFHDSNTVGSVAARIMHDVEGVRNLFAAGLFDLVGALFTAGGALCVLFSINSRLAAYCFLLVVGYALWLSGAMRKVESCFLERNALVARVTGRLIETLSGIRLVKVYVAERSEEAVFSTGVAAIARTGLNAILALSLLDSVAVSWIGVASAIMLYIGATQVMSGALSIGGLLTFAVLLAFVVAPLSQFAGVSGRLGESMAAIERTRELLANRLEEDNVCRTVALPPIRGNIFFENVNFEYVSQRRVLRDVTFRAEPGVVTALVGPSGAGKSTVMGLIAAFYEPTGGKIWVDGADLSVVRLDSYRSQLGLVTQESFLFDGTILENVAFSRPGASEREILQACRLARVDEFAERFKEGYDTVVGERGVKLSGGQRQRISIARAILADSRIFMLDEATSSLDAESEYLVQEGLQYLMKSRTTFVIAHRFSTIRHADQILVIEDGRVVESGRHEHLWASGARYRDLYARQVVDSDHSVA